MFEALWLSDRCRHEFFTQEMGENNTYLKYIIDLFVTFKDNREVLTTFYNMGLQAKELTSEGDLNGS